MQVLQSIADDWSNPFEVPRKSASRPAAWSARSARVRFLAVSRYWQTLNLAPNEFRYRPGSGRYL